MDKLQMKWTGISPLLMHNGRLADPNNEYAEAMKVITGKKKKTKDDRIELSFVEWEGGLYFDEERGPYLPTANIEGCFADGGRKSRSGQDVACGLTVNEPSPVICAWPKKKDLRAIFDSKTFTDSRCVVIKQNRIMRTRPIFWPWAATIHVDFDPEILNREDVIRFAKDAGKLCGIGDGTPKFGRFTVEVIE